MVAIKSQAAASMLATLDARVIAVLVHGNEPGLVAELAKLAADRLAARDAPPGEILRIEDAELEADPDRIAVELRTIAMFGGRKVVRTAISRRVNLDMLKDLVEGGRLEGSLVVEGGSLKADDKTRAMFEKSPNALAIACYADGARDLEGLVREILDEAKITISAEARQLLVARLGADRMLSRAEIDKLALYTAGKPRIEVEDVEAIVGDAAELAIDRVVMAAAGGNPAEAVVECDRAVASGENPQSIILAVQRHFHRIDRLRAGLDAGRSFDDAARMLRPPLFFKQKDAMEAQCRIWSSEHLARIRNRISETARLARLQSDLDAVLAERLLLEIATIARGRAGQRR